MTDKNNKHKNNRVRRNGNGLKNGQSIPPNEIEAMFQAWIKTGNLADVGREFNHSNTGIHRIKTRYKWVARRKKIIAAKEKAFEKQIIKEEVSNQGLLIALRNKLANILLQKDTHIDAKPQDLTTVIRLLEELNDNLPKDGGLNIYQILGDGIASNLTDKDLAHRFRQYGAVLARSGNSKNRF